MKKAVMILFSLFTLMGISSIAFAEEHSLWKTTVQGVNNVYTWSVNKSKQGWKATKNGATGAMQWTSDKTKTAWESTKESSVDAAEWTAKTSKRAWSLGTESMKYKADNSRS